jgi:CHAT domain-containing protein
MGPIPSGDHVGRYFCDIYIPSYTSTLSALLDARKPVSQKSKSDRPSLLLVAHHDQKPKGLRKEIGVVKWLRRPRVKTLKGKGATAAAVVEGLQRHPFVHIAGSYKLESGRPLEARLELYRGERLTLLDIVRRCPAAGPGAEFAFLSASHTAELIDENIPDEALHLASAMQHCGFRSVVGTMWGMADEDGKVVCERFYKRMFAKDGKGEGGEEAPCYERAAGALRDAVQKLRKKKGVSVDRWVTYVHYGA